MSKKYDKKCKILVIGLDGATWNILNNLIGELYNLRKLISEGCYGKLESCLPPTTFPAWKCYSTGKNPGKLGVYWWLNLDVQTKTVIMNNSKSFKSMEIWDYLSNMGFKCGVIGMPTTYPPKEINGFLVSEFNPSNSKFTYPEYLADILKKKFNYIAKFEDYHGKNREIIANLYTNLIEQRFKATKYLISKFNVDFLNVVIFHIDGIQHFYWKYMEQNDKRFGDVIRATWKLIDEKLGELIDNFCPNYVFIISDHGFTSLKGMFNLLIWLLGKRYTFLKGKFLSFLGKTKLLPYIARVSKFFLKHFISGVNDFTTISMNSLDWKKSKVIPFGEGLLYINEKAFSSKSEIENFCEKLIHELMEVKDPLRGEPILMRVFNRHEIYNGKYVNKAPHLILLANEGYEIRNAGLSKKLWDFHPKEEGWSATHTPYGIFIAHGKDIKKNQKLKNIRIYDIAPTILHIYGLPIPNDMDGRVLMEIFEPGSEISKRRPIYVQPLYYSLQRIKRKG